MKVINWVSNILLYAAVAVAAILMLLTVADVTGRYLFNSPVLGATELTEFLMACMLLGMAPCALAKRHVKIDIIISRFPARMQAILECIYYLVGMVVVAFLSWAAFEHALLELSFHTSSQMLKLPNFPFIIVLTVSFAILFLFIGVLLIQRIGDLVRRK